MLNTADLSAQSVMTTSAHEFRPRKLIVLSELSIREKEKYFRLLMLNNAKFRKDDQGHYVANVRLLAPSVRKSVVVDEQKKKRDTSNYALIFQERLLKLKSEGFIEVRVQGLPEAVAQSFDYNQYPRFAALVAFHQEVVRPKLRPLAWVMKYIEDIYDARFAHERHDVERDPEETSSFDLILAIFPVFVVRRLGTNVGLKSIVDQTCWDLLYSIHVYRRDYLEVETFARFLQEFYDHDDLLFYLYVRSVIGKVLRVQFKARWMKLEGPARQAKPLWMSYREATHVARVVFGNDNEEMLRNFLSLITPQMVGSRTESTDSRRMDIVEYLHLSVIGYHQSQARNSADGGNGERYLVPLPGQTTPLLPVPMPDSAAGLFLQPLPQESVHQPQQMSRQASQYGDSDKHSLGSLSLLDENLVLPTPSEMQRHYDRSREQMGKYDPPESDDFIPAYDMDYDLHLHAHELPADGNDENNDFAAPIDAQEEFGEYIVDDVNAQFERDEDLLQPQENELYYNDELAMQNIEQQFDNELDERGNYMSSNAAFVGSDEELYESLQQLQHEREQEFMTQLCGPIEHIPQDVFGFVEEQLRDRLHETVSMFLADKQVDSLEALDDAILEILQLDQLRIDMESLRDEMVQLMSQT